MATSNSSPQFQVDDLGRLLFQTMRLKSLTALQLAQQIGCHRSLLYRWLKGECFPHKPAYLQGIAQVCDCELQTLLNMMVGTQERRSANSLGERLRSALSQVREPADPDQGLAMVVELFQAARVELFLVSPASVACLWRARLHPFDPAQVGALIRLYTYAVDWRARSPHTEEEAVACSFVLGQVVEFAAPKLPSSWLAAAPLAWGPRNLGCLVLRGAARPGLSPVEAALLRECCAYLAEGVGAQRQLFDQMGRIYAARVLADLYLELRGEEVPLEKGKSPLGRLMEQAGDLGLVLLSLARRLRHVGIAFNDLSIQHIEPDTGVMLSVGTLNSKALRVPAIYDISVGRPCWEAFKTDRIVYRPDLSKDNPYHEGDPFQPHAVQAIADFSFAYEQGRGTVGINSLQPHPWSEQELQRIAGLLNRFTSRKRPSR